MRRLIALAPLLVSDAAAAQVRPQPGMGDPRIQTVDYRADQVVLIEGSPGYQVTIELAPDETVQTAAVGDSGAWQVSVNKAGNRLFVKPVQSGAATNLSVTTDVRSYAFDLSNAAGGQPPYTVRFRYTPAATDIATMPVATKERLYRLGGARSLRPHAIHDDGIHTYVEWLPGAPLPATYAVDSAGREMLANGNMRGNVYVIDGVAERLVFRIDRIAARAERLPPIEPDDAR